MNYLGLGWDHIINIYAYDHLLFLLLLILPLYEMHIWTLIKLVTAFTIGHALTIIIAANYLPEGLIYMTELLIPVTIVLTGIKSLYSKGEIKSISVSYFVLVGIFGLIHGLGFAAAIRGMMMGEESLIWPLLQFNIGVEVGQIVVLIVIIVLLGGMKYLFKKMDSILYFSLIKSTLAIIGILMAVWMLIERW